jgi:hypothetical protein
MTDNLDPFALYQQTFDGVPLYNGFSGYGAPHQYTMRELLNLYDPRILQALASRGSLGVVIDHAADSDGLFRKFVMAYPGAVMHETHPGWSSYRLPGNDVGEPLPDQKGQPIPIASFTASAAQAQTPRAVDGSLKTRWTGGAQHTSASFVVELGQPQHVGQLVIALGEYWTDYPMRLRLEVSSDGSQWETVYLGDTALHAYYAALRHPKEVPVVYPIDRDNVRTIRLTQIGDGNHDWSIPEIRVLR